MANQRPYLAKKRQYLAKKPQTLRNSEFLFEIKKIHHIAASPSKPTAVRYPYANFCHT